MPGRAGIDDPAVRTVDDVHQLVIDRLCPLPLGLGLPVLEVHDVVREDVVEVFTGDTAADTHADQLAGTACIRGQVGGDLHGVVCGHPQLYAIDHVDQVHNLRILEDLAYLVDDLLHVIVRLPGEERTLIREDDDEDRQDDGQTGGLIAAAVALERHVSHAGDHLPHPFAVDGLQLCEAHHDAELLRMLYQEVDGLCPRHFFSSFILLFVTSLIQRL